MTTDGFHWYDLLSPFCGAFFGAVFALAFGWLLKRFEEKDRRRTALRKAIVILAAYKEDLDWGYRILEETIACIESNKMPLRLVALSKGAWENFKLETDFILELHLLKEQQVEGIEQVAIRSLPTKLQSCFEHTTVDYRNTMDKILKLNALLIASTDWKSTLSEDFFRLNGCRNVYVETTNLTYAAIERLSREAMLLKTGWLEKFFGYR